MVTASRSTKPFRGRSVVQLQADIPDRRFESNADMAAGVIIENRRNGSMAAGILLNLLQVGAIAARSTTRIKLRFPKFGV